MNRLRLPIPVITDVRCGRDQSMALHGHGAEHIPCPYVAKDGAELARAESALDDLFRN